MSQDCEKGDLNSETEEKGSKITLKISLWEKVKEISIF